MKRFNKILLTLIVFTILFLVGGFLFNHFPQNASPVLGLAHAQDLHTDLVNSSPSQPTAWIFTIWKVALALANVIVIVMLLFVAVVNIVHLQYDTYAIKKSLPLLIIGIIMANFSLLICRMIVDAAQVLSNTFAADPRALAGDLMCSMGFMTTGGTITATIIGTTTANTAIILLIILMFVILLAVCILAFLLWIRKTVIFLLVAVAPVAFIMYAFPPTQGLFKQWWGWFLKWTFMGPIVMLLVWVASQIGSTNCSVIRSASSSTGTFNISALFATAGVLYLAAIVPFKLGGGVMSAWGKAGQWATGTNKNGYLRKPIDENIQRKKDAVKGAVNRAYGNTRLGQYTTAGRQRDEAMKKYYESEKNLQNSVGSERAKEEMRGRGFDIDSENANAEQIIDRNTRTETRRKKARVLANYRDPVLAAELANEEVADMTVEGQIESEKKRRTLSIYRSESGHQLAELEGDIATTEAALTKTKEDKRLDNAAERLTDHNRIPADFRTALDQRDRARERISNTRAGSTERTAAEGEMTAAETEITRQRGELLVGRGTGVTRAHSAAEIDQFQNHNYMERVVRTRQFAIANPRMHEDAKDGATSQTPLQAAEDMRDPTGFNMGPNHANAGDNVEFINGRQTSSHQASIAVVTKMAQQQKVLENRTTAGAGMQGYVRMVNDAGAGAEIDGGITDTLANMTDEARAEIQTFFDEQHAAGRIASADINAANLASVQMNTAGSLSHNEFVSQLTNNVRGRDSATFRSGLNGNLANYI